MPSRSVVAPLFALAFALVSSAGATACLSSDNPADRHGGNGADAAFDAGLGSITTGGSVGVDGGSGAVTAHVGFGVVSGGVKAASSAHVLVTTTGQAPGGNGAMHSTAHAVVGGVAGATQ
jgi:hypothetical protein